MTHKIAESYRKERSNLLEFIRSKVRCYEDAEDILQDVFYQAVVNMNVFEPIDNMIGWLYKVAKNRIIDWYRRKKPIELSNSDDQSLDQLIGDSRIEFSDSYTRDLVYEAILEAIEALPENQRTVFILHAIEGLKFNEIAAIEGVSINTLLARKRYAVATLRKRLSYINTLINTKE